MKTKHALLTVTLLFLVAAGCEYADDANPLSADAPHQAPEDIQSMPIATPPAAHARMRIPRSERTPAQRAFTDSVFAASGYVGNTTRELIDRAEKRGLGWQVADVQVRRMLSHFQKETAYAAEQVAAVHMLERALFKGALTTEKQEAIAFYTQLLLDHESPVADVLLRSLQSLQGYWSDVAVAQAAAQTVQHAEAWLATQAEAASKAETILHEQPNREELLDARARRLLAVRGAVVPLKTLFQ